MTIPSSIFKAYDIRGIYPTEINEKSIQQIVSSIALFLRETFKRHEVSIVLGRDMRTSSPSLFESARKTLIDIGVKVINIGLVSTPTFYFAVLDGEYDAGIQISASHNPREYNGIKAVRRDGKKLIKIGKNTGMSKIKELSQQERSLTDDSAGGQSIQEENVLKKEVDFAFQLTSPSHLQKLKIVADPANAMGALYLEELFKRIPCEAVRMNFELDGTFPAHQPDPLQFDTLKDLQQKVIKEKADLGIAPDGDGDRVFFIDEKGQIIPSTLISALIVKEILSTSPEEKILVDIRYTRNVARICETLGGKLSISNVGHALITEQLNKENAAFAGESSGHFYFRETGGAESSIRVILYVLEAMGRANLPISKVLKPLSSSFESGEINFVLKAQQNAKEILEKFASLYQGAQISWLDGLSVEYSDWRFNIRTSNTEPLLRLNAEADSEEVLRKRLNQVLEELETQGAARK